MSFLGYSRVCSATPCRTHCYLPVTPSVTLCSSDVSPAIGLCLPSSYQGNLWLLDNHLESYCEAPSCEFLSCEPKTCTPSGEPLDASGPCDSSSPGEVPDDHETTNGGSSANSNSCPQTKGYVSSCHTASKPCHTLRNDSTCFSKSYRPINYCSLGSLGYRSFRNLGFISSGFSPSYYIASNCRPQSYLTRNCQYLSSRPVRYRPLSCLPRSYRSLSCIPSTFPPLRYLCSSIRPWNCY